MHRQVGHVERVVDLDQPPVCVGIVGPGPVPDRTQQTGEAEQADDGGFLRVARATLDQALRLAGVQGEGCRAAQDSRSWVGKPIRPMMAGLSAVPGRPFTIRCAWRVSSVSVTTARKAPG